MSVRRGFQNVVLALTVSLLLLAILEVVLRTTHLFGARVSDSKPDSILAYRFVPNADYYFFKENDHAIEGTINSFGWRDNTWSTAKPRGVVRVAVLGDSFVEAFQVELESTFVKTVERRLNERGGTRVEMMNFGDQGLHKRISCGFCRMNLLCLIPTSWWSASSLSMTLRMFGVRPLQIMNVRSTNSLPAAS